MKKNSYKKPVNNLKINWPAIIALAIALGAISSCNEKRVEEYNKQQVHENMINFEKAFERAKEQIEEHEILPIPRLEDYINEESQNGRSK